MTTTKCITHDLNACVGDWHDNGCGAFYQYSDEAGYDISGSFTAERDAVERRYWEGPDGPSFVEVKNRRGSWVDQDTRRARKVIKVTWHDVDTNRLCTTLVLSMYAAVQLAMEVSGMVSDIRFNGKTWE